MKSSPHDSFKPPRGAEGDYERAPTTFRDWVRADGSTRFAPEAGRYHLYVSLACPWASRTVIIRKLRKLESVIPMSIVGAEWSPRGWSFNGEPGSTPDSANGAKDLIDIYRLADPKFPDGEETVPVLWDTKHKTIVNNESAEIIRMLDTEFRAFGDPGVDLYPEALRPKIDETIRAIYPSINNGVYRAGFAGSQGAYERAVKRLFEMLGRYEGVLGAQRFLCGEVMTEADICLFTTLIRFDAVYYSHFKCNVRRLIDYPNLSRYLRDVYETPGVADTVSFDHIKRHYYRCHTELNPSGIVPVGPEKIFR